MLIKLLTRQTVKNFVRPQRCFSEIVDPQKKEWLDKLIINYKVEDKLAPFKDEIANENDYKVMRLPPNATVKQIYLAYTNHTKFLENPKIEDRDVSKNYC